MVSMLDAGLILPDFASLSYRECVYLKKKHSTTLMDKNKNIFEYQ